MAAITGAAADAKKEEAAFAVAESDEFVAERLHRFRLNASCRLAHLLEEFRCVAHRTSQHRSNAVPILARRLRSRR
jgi:hypothetical protein